MTQPPGGPGTPPPGPYGQGGYGQGGYGQGGYGYPPPPPPPQSPWSSPAVLVAIGAGILLVVVGVLAALLWIPADDDSDDERAAASSAPSTFTDTVTRTQTPTPQTTTPPTTTTALPTTPRPAPTVPGADWQGFADGPRCNAADDPAVAIGQTTASRVVICQVGTQTGRWYYKGRSAQGSIELQFPTRIGNTFEARNGAVRYLVSPGSLTITEGGAVLAEEPMLAYWSQP